LLVPLASVKTPTTINIVDGASIRLLSMENYISLFLRITCHLKYFKTVNKTISKIYDFILEFDNTKFYVLKSDLSDNETYEKSVTYSKNTLIING
jgi:hypothetical protein